MQARRRTRVPVGWLWAGTALGPRCGPAGCALGRGACLRVSGRLLGRGRYGWSVPGLAAGAAEGCRVMQPLDSATWAHCEGKRRAQGLARWCLFGGLVSGARESVPDGGHTSVAAVVTAPSLDWSAPQRTTGLPPARAGVPTAGGSAVLGHGAGGQRPPRPPSVAADRSVVGRMVFYCALWCSAMVLILGA